MLPIHHFPLFPLSALLLNLTPGPDTLYVLGRTVAQGRRVGLLSVLGISSGILVHTCAAGAGLSALLAASATAFTVVRYAGAAYLAYLGLRLILTSDALETTPGHTAAPGNSSWAALPPGRHHQRAQPQGRPLLPRLPPAVRRSHRAAPHPRVLRPRPRLRHHRHPLVRHPRLLRRRPQHRVRQRPTTHRWLNRLSGTLFIGLGVKVARG